MAPEPDASTATRESNQARFVVSQDFELHWGVRDKRSVEEYRENLLGVRRAIPATLRLFEEFAIHATWASVGFLFFDGRDDLMAHLPEFLPTYDNPRYSPYESLTALGRNEEEDPFHFAPSLLRLITESRGQELGTHTFSHYYCLEPGNDARAFESDLRAAQRAAERFNVRLRSLVFPRNQVNAQYLPVCARLGIRSYRGTPIFAAYRPRTNELNGWLARAGRLADNYLPLSGHNSFQASPGHASPYDIPASSFLRPHSRRLARLEPRRLRRIVNALTHAAKHGLTYHLWWHPHNFGADLNENLAFLRRILAHVADLRIKYGMQSVNMAELADAYDRDLEGRT